MELKKTLLIPAIHLVKLLNELGMIYVDKILKIGNADFIAPEDKVNFQSSFDEILKKYNN